MDISPEMLAAKDTLWDAIENAIAFIPNVQGIDVGMLPDGPEITDDVAIRIFLADENYVPPQLQLLTAAIPFPVAFTHREFTPLKDNGLYDPVVGGITVSAKHGGINEGAGTLGGIAIDTMFGGLVGVSCAHVVADSDIATVQQGDPINQPNDGRRIGRLYRWSEDTDIAVFTIDNASAEQRIAEIGPCSGMAEAKYGDLVRKRGRTTLLTLGKVTGVGLKVRGLGTSPNSFEIWSRDSHPQVFADAGDSGSLIINEHDQVVGILTQSGLSYSRFVTIGTPPPGAISGFATQMVSTPGYTGAAESVGISF